MSTIQIKRGLQANVNSLSLAEGEFAVALDTGNVYIGAQDGALKHINPTGGTADTATKLSTARAFSISGDGTAEAVNFDGTAAVNLVLALATQSGLSAGTYTKMTVNEKGVVTAATNIAVSDISGLGTAATKNTGTSSGNVVAVGSDGKIASSLIPSLAIMDIYEAESEAAMLALSGQKGDICIRTDEAKTYILAGDSATVKENWKWLQTPDCKVQSVNGKTGAVVIEDATTSSAGLLSATDKTKLDGIATGANNYSLPTASASTLGGVKVGTGLTIAAGVLSLGNIDGGTF